MPLFYSGVYVNHTGGSTGAPLTFVQDAAYLAWAMAELDRDFQMCGYRVGQRQAFFWGSDRDSGAHRTARGKLYDLLANLRWVDAFDLSVPLFYGIAGIRQFQVEQLTRVHLVIRLS